MKCPICGKELELKNKQIGTSENGDPIFNEYAICRDCRKQWNLDKQRAKKAAAKSSVQAKSPDKKAAAAAPPAPKSSAPTPKNTSAAAAERPVKKRSVQNTPVSGAEEKRYSNVPPERVRTKHEKAARKSYEDMLATGTIGKPVKKRKAQPEEDTRAIPRTSSTGTVKTAAPARTSAKRPEPEADEYEDDYYEDTPRFRVMRVLLAVLSLLGSGYFMYRGFTVGISSTADSGVSGMTLIIFALCLLVSALLYFITIGTNSIFAFLLPMLFYLGSGVFAFLKREDDLQLFIAAVAAVVLAVISLILSITSRGGDDYDDYDDAFEDDYAD